MTRLSVAFWVLESFVLQNSNLHWSHSEHCNIMSTLVTCLWLGENPCPKDGFFFGGFLAGRWSFSQGCCWCTSWPDTCSHSMHGGTPSTSPLFTDSKNLSNVKVSSKLSTQTIFQLTSSLLPWVTQSERIRLTVRPKAIDKFLRMNCCPELVSGNVHSVLLGAV